MRLSPRCRAILSGDQAGPRAGLIRSALAVPATLYKPVVGLRNWLYDHGWKKTYQLPVPVICVGNLTVGGTGKTPLVIWLCRLIQRRGLRVAILSRGYRGPTEQGNDETTLLRQALPEVPIVINPDRVQGGRQAVDDHRAQVLVLDDGFQHRRLRRDLDIVLIDCTCPFGYGHLLPRGLLREPPNQLRRADVVILSHCDMISKDELARLEQHIRQYLPPADAEARRPATLLVHSQHQPIGLFGSDGTKYNLSDLQGKRVFAFCGIGNPQAFEDMLRQLGAELKGHYVFGDHYIYDELDAKLLHEWRSEFQADRLVTTEKDWVKLRQIPPLAHIEELCWLKVETRITRGKEELGRRIVEILEGCPRR
ncbi:MAG: tetraacyldisaccharide 4'-kinase [Sedimentisphaerales bacterium]|nr:tetraacyldisaccharide 4'-kinase [Sedimentisphaerales bacterium]